MDVILQVYFSKSYYNLKSRSLPVHALKLVLDDRHRSGIPQWNLNHLQQTQNMVALVPHKNILAEGANTMPADALAPKVGRASTGMVLAV